MTDHFAAPAPNSNSGSFTLSVGLLAVPISVATGTNSQTMLTRQGFVPVGDEWHESGSRPYDKVTGENIERGDIVYRAQADDGTWVTVDDDEMEQALGDGTSTAEVVAFAPRSTLCDVYVPIKWDQARPAMVKKGRDRMPDPAAERVWVILTEAMRQRDVVAIVRAKRQWYALTPEGWWIRLAFADTVRGPRELPAVEPSEAEVAMAAQLIDAYADVPVLADEAGPRLRGYVNEKAASGERPALTVVPETPAAVDAMAALVASVNAAKKKAA